MKTFSAFACAASIPDGTVPRRAARRPILAIGGAPGAFSSPGARAQGADAVSVFYFPWSTGQHPFDLDRRRCRRPVQRLCPDNAVEHGAGHPGHAARHLYRSGERREVEQAIDRIFSAPQELAATARAALYND